MKSTKLINMSLRRFLSGIYILLLLLAALSCNTDWLDSEYNTTVYWEGAYEGLLSPEGQSLARGLLSVVDND